MTRIRAYIRERLINFIIENIEAGGHCGLCGKWVPHALVSTDWAWTLCDNCYTTETCAHGGLLSEPCGTCLWHTGDSEDRILGPMPELVSGVGVMYGELRHIQIWGFHKKEDAPYHEAEWAFDPVKQSAHWFLSKKLAAAEFERNRWLRNCGWYEVAVMPLYVVVTIPKAAEAALNMARLRAADLILDTAIQNSAPKACSDGASE